MDARVKKIISVLNKLYPDPKPSLKFKNPFESLIATVLSAQCTDERVNIVTEKLFKTANTPEKFLSLGEKKLARYIRPTGFYRTKAKNLIAASHKLMREFNGAVPPSLEKMQTLPGVGRKTASVVLAQAFKIPAFPVDRHIFRAANRLGLANAKTPDETDLILRKTITKKLWIPLHLQLIYHGRQICRPKPKCGICPLLPYCPEGKHRQQNIFSAKSARLDKMGLVLSEKAIQAMSGLF